MEYEWPVTVKKRRHGTSDFGSSVFEKIDTSYTGVRSRRPMETISYQNIESNSREDMLINMHIPEKVVALQDLEITPKANKVVSRTTSADTFLKSDFHRRSSLINASRFSVRGQRNPLLSRKKLRNESAGSSKPPPVAPERHSSKSKRFLQLGLAGRDHHVDQIQSTATKKKLIRCVSRNRNLSSSSSEESFKSRLSNNFYVERSSNYKDIFEVQRSSFENSLDTPLLSSMCSEDNSQHLDALVLCPEIKIIPEVTSVDIGDFCFWVAIEIKGVLRRPDRDFDKCEQKEDLVTSDARYSNLSGT